MVRSALTNLRSIATPDHRLILNVWETHTKCMGDALGPRSHFKNFDETAIISPITSGGPPASYTTLIAVSFHLQS